MTYDATLWRDPDLATGSVLLPETGWVQLWTEKDRIGNPGNEMIETTGP